MGPSQWRAQIIGADAHEGGDEEEEFCGENDGDGAVEGVSNRIFSQTQVMLTKINL